MDCLGFRLVESYEADSSALSRRVPVIAVKDVADLSPYGFDLAATLESGQAFRWRRLPDAQEQGGASSGKGRCVNHRFSGIVRGRAVETHLTPDGRDLVLTGCTAEDFVEVFHPYFDLGRDYAPILRAVAKDPFMEAALRFGGGARLLVQEFHETLFSYILSAQNNIPRIMGLVEALSASYGDPLPGSARLAATGHATSPDGSLFSFPSVEALARAAGRCRGRLDGCRSNALCAGAFAGYRCPYLMRTAMALHRGGVVPDPETLRALPADAARDALRVLPGVGAKVADCTLLSSGLHTEVCPVDRWVERTIRTVYLSGESEEAGTEGVRRFVEGYFGSNAGFAQLWFFLYSRSGGGLSATAPSV